MSPAAAPAQHGLVALASGGEYSAGAWSPAGLARLLAHLSTRGAVELRSLDDAALLGAWGDTVEAFLDARSPERRSLDPPLVELTRLSPAGLDAALQAVLGGVRSPHARALFARAAGMERAPTPAVAVLAGNLPGLAVQPLLPALALRRPLLLKSASAEPLFAAAFVTALSRRLPPLGEGIAAATWPGGDARLEAPLLAAAGRVLAYGDRAAIASLACRAPGKVVDYGPKLSIAVLGDGADLDEVARGIARDVALFEQRGCLSVQAVFVAGPDRARELGRRLALALAAIAVELPPGPLPPGQAALVQQLRGEAEMRGALAGPSSLAEGTVILEPNAERLDPSPGLRTVRVYATTLAELPSRLAAWSGLLQGAALAGAGAWELAPALAALGVSRCTAPGELQSPDASWHNGGHDPLVALQGN